MSSIALLLDENDVANAEHWEMVAREAAPRVDVTRAGVLRAAISYALSAAETMAATDAAAAARRLTIGPWHLGAPIKLVGRAHLTPVKLVLPSDLLARLQGRGRELLEAKPENSLRAVVTVFLNFGLRGLYDELAGEVAEFLRAYFEGEVGNGLRRGRPRRAAA